jgi:diacylglycerol kinase family enzyme
MFSYKDTSRLAMAKVLLGLENGSHVDMPQAEFIECSAYRLEPITKGSFNDLDGEVIESGPIQGKVMPSAMKVFCK